MASATTTPRYGSAAELATYAGLSVKTVRRLVDAGEVPAFKVGRRLVIPFDEIDRHIRSRRRPAVMATIQPPATAGPKRARAPYVPPIEPPELARRNRAAVALLDAWESEGDEADQRETMAVLRESLGRDRVASSRPLFP